MEGLLDATSGADADLLLRYRECHLLVLKALQDGRAYGPQWCNKQITRCLIECRDEYKYNVDAVELLIRNHLVNMQQYDLHLAQVHTHASQTHASQTRTRHKHTRLRVGYTRQD